jgi:hypothetical protein
VPQFMSLSDWAYCLAYHCRYRAARRLWSFTNLILHFAVVRLEEDHGDGLKSDQVKRRCVERISKFLADSSNAGDCVGFRPHGLCEARLLADLFNVARAR